MNYKCLFSRLLVLLVISILVFKVQTEEVQEEIQGEVQGEVQSEAQGESQGETQGEAQSEELQTEEAPSILKKLERAIRHNSKFLYFTANILFTAGALHYFTANANSRLNDGSDVNNELHELRHELTAQRENMSPNNDKLITNSVNTLTQEFNKAKTTIINKVQEQMTHMKKRDGQIDSMNTKFKKQETDVMAELKVISDVARKFNEMAKQAEIEAMNSQANK